MDLLYSPYCTANCILSILAHKAFFTSVEAQSRKLKKTMPLNQNKRTVSADVAPVLNRGGFPQFLTSQHYLLKLTLPLRRFHNLLRKQLLLCVNETFKTWEFHTHKDFSVKLSSLCAVFVERHHKSIVK